MNDNNLDVTVSIKNEIKSLTIKRNLYLIGSVISFGIGSYYFSSANKHYNEYLSANDNAAELREKIELEEQLSPISYRVGGLLFLPTYYYHNKMWKLKRLLWKGLFEE